MKKVLIGIVAVLVLLLLLQISFFGKEDDKVKEIEYSPMITGIHSLDIQENSFSLKNEIAENGLNINYISPFDKVLYVGDLNIEGNNINLGKGVYLINITELNSSWTISGEGFSVKNNGPTTFFVDSTFVDTRGPMINIFSQNTILDLELLDEANNKVNNVYLYPHMFIKLRPNANKNVGGADRWRVSQFSPLSYFGEKILNDNVVSENFISKVIGEKSTNLEDIKKMFLFLKFAHSDDKKLTSFKDAGFGTSGLSEFLEPFKSWFLNDIKKSVYDKNKVLDLMGNLLNNDSGSQVDLLVDTMNELKKLNEGSYNEMKNILYFYTSIILNSTDISLDTKLNFSKLYNSLEGKEFKNMEEYLVSLNNTYSKLDIETKNDTQKYNEMYKELNDLFAQINSLPSKDRENYKKLNGLVANLDNLNSISYLIFFLNDVIISGFNLDVNMINILDIFKEYTNISYTYYSKDNDNVVVIRTGIAEYSKMLDELFDKIKEFFFAKDRDANKKLILINLNLGSEMKILKNDYIDKIFKYFDDNQDKLRDNEKANYIKNFGDLKVKSDEYFRAITNYKDYINEDIIVGGNTTFELLSIASAKEYLKGFEALNVSDAKISLRNMNYCSSLLEEDDVDEKAEPYCYKIENLVINNNVRLDFLLIPSRNNEMSDISKNGKPITASYKLDNQKEELEEQRKTSVGSDDPNLKFENFFRCTFIGCQKSEESSSGGPTLNECEIQDLDDLGRGIRATLINNFLSTSQLSGFIKIEACNLTLTRQKNYYSVQIKNAKLTYNRNNTNEKYNGNFNSNYIRHENKSEDVFENPAVIFYNDRNVSLLNGNKVNFKGKFELQKIKNDFTPFFDNFNILSNVVNDISNNLGISQLNITYTSISGNNITIKGNKLEITIRGTKINSVIYDNKRIAANIEVSELSKTLQSLNR